MNGGAGGGTLRWRDDGVSAKAGCARGTREVNVTGLVVVLRGAVTVSGR
ncbi:hypothetical protein SAMN06265355_101378 [Actinomadura mexicana]|uniref:Uncharacterized protein n=1 Tax=Actinomadura mexicana TaxID=134959 RepID=A0A238UV25_9ACTN|nr:hypothetical protein SAMN06265355_101378 [Actinomadura mexicana]